jgi:ribonuclease III
MPPDPRQSTKDLESCIGYTFHDPVILIKALHHHAPVNENFTKNENFMEPLATLGDAILGAAVGYKLYEDRIRDKGTLTEEKIRKMKHFRTRKFAEKLQVVKYIQWDLLDNEGQAWAKSTKALDLVIAALIGAVFLDAQKNGMNGMTVVRDMLEHQEYFG